MHLPRSETIAKAHPALASLVGRIDDLIYNIGEDPIRVEYAADTLSVAPDVLERILMLFVIAGLLRQEKRAYCSRCESLIDDVDAPRECDNCDAQLSKHAPDCVDVFSVVYPIIRLYNDTAVDADRTSLPIVFVAGDRGGSVKGQLQLPKELRLIKAAIQSAEHRDLLHVGESVFAASLKELAGLYSQSPGIVHFGGHGDDRSLVLVRDQELLAETVAITAERLSKMFQNYPTHLTLCVLNVCDSIEIAKRLVGDHAAEFAVGWRGKLPDASAITFAEQLYHHLGNGLSLAQAFTLAEQCATPDDAPYGARLFSGDERDARKFSIFTR